MNIPRTNKLDSFFNPKSIVVVGASNKKENAGHAVMRNLIYEGFGGRIYPVNPNAENIFGSKCYPSVTDIPEEVDLAIIATPAATVNGIVEECVRHNIRDIIIISAGLKEVVDKNKNHWEKLITLIKNHDLRVLGPNCLGYIRPSLNLNASFANKIAKPGKIAFISQSGALCSSILDWSLKENIGFSYFVSIGEMAGIGFHDLIDHFGRDPETSSILIYMESLTEPRLFLSAARAYARTKPIIVLKAGRSQEGAKAAVSHTGSLTGNDEIFDAAFKRAGVLRVDTINELFNCVEILSSKKLPESQRLAIITNAGGPGVIGTDYLIKSGGSLASFSQETIKNLSKHLPNSWSKGNPADILGDATAERYKKTLEIVGQDKNVDAIMIFLTPQAMTDPEGVAKGVVELNQTISKPVLTSFMGGDDVEKGKIILDQNQIPTYATPEDAVRGFMNMYQYKRNLQLLYETPSTTPHAFTPKVEETKKIIQEISKTGRLVLTELEAKQILSNYEIATPQATLAVNAKEAGLAADKIGYPVAMKIVSPQIYHKTEVKGVKLDIKSKNEAEAAYKEIANSVINKTPEAEIKGVLIEPMIHKKYELFIGCKKDPIFGPAIVFGMGGVAVEVFNDINIGLPPLNMALAQRVIEGTKIYQLLKGFRNIKPVDIPSIQFLLYKFSYLVMDFPEIKELDINPFVVDEQGGIVLDAKIILDKEVIKKPIKPYSHLVISPYPKNYIKSATLKNGRQITLRPIKPEDEIMEAEMFSHFSEETLRFRFFAPIKDITHELLIRFTQIDYDREIAIIAEWPDGRKKKMLGVARIISDGYQETGEFAIVVADQWQGQGLGSMLMDYIIQIAKDKGLKKIYSFILPDNTRMKAMMEKRNFKIQWDGDMFKAELPLN